MRRGSGRTASIVAFSERSGLRHEQLVDIDQRSSRRNILLTNPNGFASKRFQPPAGLSIALTNRARSRRPGGRPLTFRCTENSPRQPGLCLLETTTLARRLPRRLPGPDRSTTRTANKLISGPNGAKRAPMHTITTTTELATACKRLAAHPYVAVDTEFLREDTYWPKLCLVQLAGPDDALIVDPLAKGIDLAPLYALMADTAVIKVFHAGRQDIEIFHAQAGVIPQPHVRYASRRHGVRLRRVRQLRQPRQAHRRCRCRQVLAVHGLEPASAVAGPTHLCARRRHPPAQRLSAPRRRPQGHRPPRMAERGDGRPHRPGHLSGRAARTPGGA